MIDPGDLADREMSAAAPDGEPEHDPQRPSWDCAACGQPWPCDPARERVATSPPHVRLRLMVSYLLDASQDRPYEPAGDMVASFVGWLDARDFPARR